LNCRIARINRIGRIKQNSDSELFVNGNNTALLYPMPFPPNPNDPLFKIVSSLPVE
jgi:hypothetical protein